MDYLSTTGDRLHDLELDRMIARLSALEAKANAVSTTTPAPVVQAVVSSVSGVRSLTPGSGTQMQGDISLAVAGPLTIAQSGSAITLTANTLAAGANVTLTTVGTTTTVAAAAGGSSIPTTVLAISPGSGGLFSWATPAALTEFGGVTYFRVKADLTNATQARLVHSNSAGSAPVNIPTLFAEYFNGSAWLSLDGVSGPSLTWNGSTSASGWATLAAGAKADVLLRISASGGNGATALAFGSLSVQTK